MLLVILSFIPCFNFSVCNLMATEAGGGGQGGGDKKRNPVSDK